MLDFYNHMSEGGLVLLVMLVSVILFTASLWLYQRLLPNLRMDSGSGDIAQIYGGAIGTVFALIFAFVIVSVWQNFDRVWIVANKEANALNNIYRNLDSYPPGFNDPIQLEMKDYVRQVVETEWPRMSSHGQDPQATAMINKIAVQIANYRPANLGEIPIHAHMMQLLTEHRSLRLDRITGAESYLDKSMWFSLDLGCGILLFFSCVVRMPSRRQHYLLNGILGASMGLVFFLLFVYNWPMQGPGCITSQPLRTLLQQHWLE